MQTPPLHFFSFNRRKGSALIATLVMVGILAMAVGVMLSTSSRAIQGSRDKIMYEEAYQAALSGTHVARAWMIQPDLVGAMTGNETLEAHIRNIRMLGLEVSDQIIFDRERNDTTDLYGPTRYTEAGLAPGATLSGGRRLLYDFPSNSPIVSFVNDRNKKSFTDNLFQGTPSGGHRNYVERIRITTPPHDLATTSVSLLETTFVIESHGVAEYAGRKKKRVLHQRVLLYPVKPGGSLLSASEAIITKSGLIVKGSSHANVHWAPVMTKGDVLMPFLTGLNRTLNTDGTFNWSALTTLSTKFNGSGTYTSDPNFPDSGVLDKWLQWKTGTKGQILGDKSIPLFGQILPAKDADDNSVPVEDFFVQVKNNVFAGAPNYFKSSDLTLGGRYQEAGTTLANPNGIVSEDGKNGALVQGSAEVDVKVDSFFGTMNYQELKEYAKAHNGYYYYDGAVLYNSVGKALSSNEWPDMVDLVPSGTDPVSATAAQDRILFVDSAADKNSNTPTQPFAGTLKLPEFWKGIVYVHGDVYSKGTGSSPNLVTRTPDEFKDYRANQTSNSHMVKNVLIDGILMCNGIAELGGNTAIYGTLAAQGGVGLGGTPSIFFNSANGEGRMKGNVSQSAAFRLIAGRLYEE